MGGQGEVLAVLAHMPERVGNVEVVELSVGVPLSDCGCQVIASDVQQREVVGDRRCVAIICSGIFCIALDRQVRLQGRDIHLLIIRPSVYEKCLRVTGGWGKCIHALLYCWVYSGCEIVGVIVNDDCA